MEFEKVNMDMFHSGTIYTDRGIIDLDKRQLNNLYITDHTIHIIYKNGQEIIHSGVKFTLKFNKEVSEEKPKIYVGQKRKWKKAAKNYGSFAFSDFIIKDMVGDISYYEYDDDDRKDLFALPFNEIIRDSEPV